jgi:hypothetical protein
MIGYVRRSETERVWVSDDGLTNLNLLKIQSVPLGNLRGSTAAFMQPFTSMEMK